MTAEQLRTYTPEQFCSAMVYAARELAELHRWNDSYVALCSDYAERISAADDSQNAVQLCREFAELLHRLTPDNQRWPAAVARADSLLAKL